MNGSPLPLPRQHWVLPVIERGEEFRFPEAAKRRILAVGIGGGCDIILAYAVARLLESSNPELLIYANTKRTDDEDLEHLSEHILRVPEHRTPLHPGEATHGTTRIEQSLPRGDRGCPLVFVLPHGSKGDQLVSEIRGMQFDLVLAVDTGGDSLVDLALSGPEGRDRQMLEILRQVGVELYHIVVAPGVDGESTYPQLAAAIGDQIANRLYRGWFPLDSIIPIIKPLAEPLDASRTPNLIVAARESRLVVDGGSFATIPRGVQPAIPLEWLTMALVFG